MSPEDWDSDDDPQETDITDDGDDDLAEMTCPSCRAVVTEDTQKCPTCGDWIIPREPSAVGLRRWIYVAIVLLTALLILRFSR